MFATYVQNKPVGKQEMIVNEFQSSILFPDLVGEMV